MFGRGIGWGVTPMGHSLAVVVGGLSTRPIMVGSSIQSREYLCLTLTLDHDVIDGAPAARFTTHLKRLIESCAGLSAESNHGVEVMVPQPASAKPSSDNRRV
jgi:hypothetical protein